MGLSGLLAAVAGPSQSVRSFYGVQKFV